MADWIKHPTKRTRVKFHELGARPKMLFLDGPGREPADYEFVHNPNGSYEAWPVGHDSGVDVYHPTENRWGCSDYADDSWLDAATGVKGWRNEISGP